MSPSIETLFPAARKNYFYVYFLLPPLSFSCSSALTLALTLILSLFLACVAAVLTILRFELKVTSYNRPSDHYLVLLRINDNNCLIKINNRHEKNDASMHYQTKCAVPRSPSFGIGLCMSFLGSPRERKTGVWSNRVLSYVICRLRYRTVRWRRLFYKCGYLVVCTLSSRNEIERR